jgi:two-component system phosphate regulon response regulator PhoB
VAERPVVLVAAPPVIQRLVQASLRDTGFRVDAISRRQLTPSIAVDREPDVVVLDAASVAEVDREIRRLSEASDVPVMVTCGAGVPMPPAAVLDAGAADVMAMPLDPAELAARVRSLVRRQGPALAAGRVQVGGVIVDLDKRTVEAGPRVRALGRTDWHLLVCLLAARGHLVHHDALLTAAFGAHAVGDLGALRAAMGRLRWKLRAADGPEPIVVVRGMGYLLPT